MDPEPPSPEAKEPSFFRRILHNIALLRAPDTTEDLEQEIQELIDEGAEQGLISSHEGMLISSILEFKDTLAHEIMTPHTEMVCAPETISIQEIVSLFTEHGFSRIPIYAESPDQIIGILHVKDLLPHLISETPALDIGKIVKPAYFVAEDYKIVELLKDFQNQKSHMAIVTDEFGSVRGLLTMEDILEEIVGEITDEYDKADNPWKEIDANTLIADAKVDIEEIENFFDIELPEGPYESAGGLILHHLGRLPVAGAEVEVPPLTFTVISASKRRIKIIKISKKTDSD